MVSGNGEFEYSIDGINYQTSNIINLPEGGIYTCYVRERAKGCGLDAKNLLQFLIHSILRLTMIILTIIGR